MARGPDLRDTAIAVAALALTLSLVADASREVDAVAFLLASLASLPLLGRRRAPPAALAVVGAASTALVWLGYVGGCAPGMLVACHALAAGGGRAYGEAALAGVFIAHVLAMTQAMAAGFPGSPAFPLFWIGAWLLGARVRG